MIKTNAGNIIGTQLDDCDVLYTRREAAAYLKTSEPTLERWAGNGTLVPHKVGPRAVRYTLRQLREVSRGRAV